MMCTGLGTGRTVVDEILTALFHCDLPFAPYPSNTERYSTALSEVEDAEKALKKTLSSESQALLRDYQKKAMRYQQEDCRLEFERGFLLGAQLMLAVLTRRVERRKK